MIAVAVFVLVAGMAALDVYAIRRHNQLSEIPLAELEAKDAA